MTLVTLSKMIGISEWLRLRAARTSTSCQWKSGENSTISRSLIDEPGDGQPDAEDPALPVPEMTAQLADDFGRLLHDPVEALFDQGRRLDLGDDIGVEIAQDPVDVRRPEIDADDVAVEAGELEEGRLAAPVGHADPDLRDQSFADEPVDDPGDGRRAQAAPLGEVRAGQAVVVADEIGDLDLVELADELGVPGPRLCLPVGELFDH